MQLYKSKKSVESEKDVFEKKSKKSLKKRRKQVEERAIAVEKAIKRYELIMSELNQQHPKT